MSYITVILQAVVRWTEDKKYPKSNPIWGRTTAAPGIFWENPKTGNRLWILWILYRK